MRKEKEKNDLRCIDYDAPVGFPALDNACGFVRGG